MRETARRIGNWVARHRRGVWGFLVLVLIAALGTFLGGVALDALRDDESPPIVEPAPAAPGQAVTLPKPERDPPDPEKNKLLGQFGSETFFGGALIVFATRIVGDRYGDITIQSLRIEAEDLSIACSHTGVRVGSAPSVRTPTQRLYTVSIRALRGGVAEVAAYRMYDPGRIGCGVASIRGLEP